MYYKREVIASVSSGAAGLSGSKQLIRKYQLVKEIMAEVVSLIHPAQLLLCRVNGGMAYSLEFPVERYYRDLKLYQVGE